MWNRRCQREKFKTSVSHDANQIATLLLLSMGEKVRRSYGTGYPFVIARTLAEVLTDTSVRI